MPCRHDLSAASGRESHCHVSGGRAKRYLCGVEALLGSSPASARRFADRGPSSAAIVLIATLALMGGIGAVLLFARSDTEADKAWNAVLTVWTGWSYIAAGVVAWSRRPDYRIGRWMIATGFLWLLSALAAGNTAGFFTVGNEVDTLAKAAFVNVLLGFPDGRLHRWPERAVATITWLDVTVAQLAVLMFTPSPRNLIQVGTHPQLAQDLHSAQRWTAVALVAVALALVARRLRSASPPLRRALVPVLASGTLVLVLVAASVVANESGWPAAEQIVLAQIAAYGLVPYAFLAGLFRSRLARASVADLVLQLGDPVAPGTLRGQPRSRARGHQPPGCLLAARECQLRRCHRPARRAAARRRRARRHDRRAQRRAGGGADPRPGTPRGPRVAAGSRCGRRTRARERAPPGGTARAARGAPRLARPDRRGRRQRAPPARAEPPRRRAAAAAGAVVRAAARRDEARPRRTPEARRARSPTRATSWRRRSRSCASSRAGSTRRSSPTAASTRRSRGSPRARSLPVEVDALGAGPAARADRGGRLLRRLARRSRTSPSTRARAASASGSAATATAAS